MEKLSKQEPKPKRGAERAFDLAAVEAYLLELERKEAEFKGQASAATQLRTRGLAKRIASLLSSVKVTAISACDYLLLQTTLRCCKKRFSQKHFVYTAINFCTNDNGILNDRVVRPIFDKDLVFISHAKEYAISKINQQKVYNIGGMVKLVANLCYRQHSTKMRIFLAYKKINNSILKHLSGNEVYSLCYYDLNGMSLVLSDYRKNIVLGEVQHGSIINYPPYVEPSPFKIADIFYVKNEHTISYLRQHLCRDFNPAYRLIPYPKVDRHITPGVHVLYASTVEFGGFHPVFLRFLEEQAFDRLHIIVRLHPRERGREDVFRRELDARRVSYEFDHSRNWLESTTIKNLIVVSPWSSTIEDSYDNGFVTVTIDPVGRERYRHLIDGKRCFYSDRLLMTLELILRSSEMNFSES